MSRYIDADVLIDDLIHNHCFYPAIVSSAIKNTPTADVVEVVHASWVWGKVCSNSGYCCTNCGCGFTGENAEWIAKEHKYCPNCGAKMDGERR